MGTSATAKMARSSVMVSSVEKCVKAPDSMEGITSSRTNGVSLKLNVA